jgi:hypothetical protein
MNKLVLIAFAAFSASAFAGGSGGHDGGHGGGTTCSECPEILINGKSFQGVAATSTLFLNAAEGRDAYAQQNVSSNSGNVTVEDGATSVQLTAARGGSLLANLALGDDAYASQNVSSNIGNVDINGSSWQVTSLSRSGVVNIATKDTKAVQNIASNNGCVACKPTSEKHR